MKYVIGADHGRLTKSDIADTLSKHNISKDADSVFSTNIAVHQELSKQFSKSVE